MTRQFAYRGVVLALVALGLGSAGCNGTHQQPLFLPRGEAEAHLRENANAINGRLRVRGSWAAQWTLRGQSESHSGTFRLYALAPDKVCLQAKAFGNNVFEVGSNGTTSWMWQQFPDDQVVLRVGSLERVSAIQSPIPLRPEMLMDALGLPQFDHVPGRTRSLYRVAADANQVIFVGINDDDQVLIERELWLDRFAPFLVKRVIHRDASGRIAVDIKLQDYQFVEAGGPMLPQRIDAIFPLDDASFELDLNDMKVFEEPQHSSLIDPRERPNTTLPAPDRIMELD